MLGSNYYLAFLERLNQQKLMYMVTGSVGCMIYGEPRMTNDIDLVLELGSNEINALTALFPDEEFYCPSPETIRTEIARAEMGHFNIIHHETGFKADIYLKGNDPLHQWAMGRRRQIQLDQIKAWVAPPEYIIIRKLQYYQEGTSWKHIRDIRRMMDCSKEIIDEIVLKSMIDEYGLSEEWKRTLETKAE